MARRKTSYNRADLQDTIRAAKVYSKKHNCIRYIFATYGGFLIHDSAPIGGQQHYKIDGERVEHIEYQGA